MRLTVLSAASRARQHASTCTTPRKIVDEPETLSKNEKLKTSSSLPATMTAEVVDGGDPCRATAALVTTPQPIRSQYGGSGRVDDISLVETPSSECVFYSVQCPQTDDAVVLSTD